MNKSPHLLNFRTHRGEPHLTLSRAPESEIKFLDLCIRAKFSLSQMADAIGVADGTLRRAFVNYSGIAPKTWMTQQRVLRALRMLREGQTLSQIAKTLGYHDYSHMSKEFKLVVDSTPRQMRVLLNRLQEPSLS